MATSTTTSTDTHTSSTTTHDLNRLDCGEERVRLRPVTAVSNGFQWIILYYTENIQFILISLSVHTDGCFNGLTALPFVFSEIRAALLLSFL